MKNSLQYLSLSILLTLSLFPLLSYAVYFNTQQDYTFQASFDIEGSRFINMEEILGNIVPYQTILKNSQSCELDQPSLSQLTNHSFKERFFNGEKPFYLNQRPHIIRIDPITSEIALVEYQIKPATSEASQETYVESHRKTLGTTSSLDTKIIRLRLYQNFIIFHTKSDITILKLLSVDEPTLVKTISLNPKIITDFGFIESFSSNSSSKLFIVADNEVLVYDMQEMANKNDYIPAKITSYNLANDSPANFKSLQTICVYENTIYLGEGDQILLLTAASDYATISSFLLSKAISLHWQVLQIEKVGRSLVVLTATELIEYIFITDSLDIRENTRASNELFGFSGGIQTETKVAAVEIKTAEHRNGTYFSLVNKLKNKVFIFQSAVLQAYQDHQHPFIFEYTAQSSIDSIETYVQFDSLASNGIVLAVKLQNGQVNIIELARDPLGMTCSSWTPKTMTLSAVITSRFCHNVMYNYTAFSSSVSKTGGLGMVYSDDFYFDPNQYCNRVIIFQLHYKWNMNVVLKLAGGVLGGLILIVFFGMIYARRKKEKAQLKHQAFHDDVTLGGGKPKAKGKGKTKEVDLEHESHKIDVSNITFPYSSERVKGNVSHNGSYIGDSKDHNTTPLSKRRNYTKKKNLQINIPED